MDFRLRTRVPTHAAREPPGVEKLFAHLALLFAALLLWSNQAAGRERMCVGDEGVRGREVEQNNTGDLRPLTPPPPPPPPTPPAVRYSFCVQCELQRHVTKHSAEPGRLSAGQVAGARLSLPCLPHKHIPTYFFASPSGAVRANQAAGRERMCHKDGHKDAWSGRGGEGLRGRTEQTRRPTTS